MAIVLVSMLAVAYLLVLWESMGQDPFQQFWGDGIHILHPRKQH